MKRKQVYIDKNRIDKVCVVVALEGGQVGSEVVSCNKNRVRSLVYSVDLNKWLTWHNRYVTVLFAILDSMSSCTVSNGGFSSHL